MSIRAAEYKDLQDVLHIMNSAILNTTAIYDYEIHTNEFIEEWFRKKQLDKMPILVFEKDNKAVAFGTYGIFRPKEGYKYSVEHSIYVNENYQGQGIGKELLKALIKTAQRDGHHTMIAGIDAANYSSCEFHKKFGFVEVGRFKEVGFKFDKWLDLVFMQLIL